MLRRVRLEEELDECFGRRLTLLLAGPGYGKSTLLSQWSSDLRCAWYGVSSDDRLPSLVAGITEAIRPYAHELPRDLSGRFTAERQESQAEVVAGRLAGALDAALAHDLILILDDLHELDSAPAALRFVEGFARQAPSTVHVVAATRNELDLRLERLRGQGQVLEITAADLAFTDEEVSGLSSATLDGDTALADRIHTLTAGWPAAVRLVLEALSPVAGPQRARELDALRDSPTLYGYLAHEVFCREPAQVRALMRDVATLGRCSVDLCVELGHRRAAAMLRQLERRGLLPEPQQGEVVLHELVRGFVKSTWPLAPDEERALHLSAARFFAARGRTSEALDAYAAAGEQREVARLLESNTSMLETSAGADKVVELAAHVAPELRTIKLEHLVSEAQMLRGNYDGAIEVLEGHAQEDGTLEPATAWRLALAYFHRGEMERVGDVYRRVRDAGEGRNAALLLAWTATAYFHTSRQDEARILAARSLHLATSCADDRALAAAHVAASLLAFRDGRGDEADRHLLDALPLAERCGDIHQLVRIHINRAAALTESGSLRSALDEVARTLELVESSALRMELRALTNRGRIHLRLGLLDEARADYGRVLEMARDRRNALEKAHAHVGLGEVQRERGNLAQARAAYERAVPILEAASALEASTPLEGLARVLVDESPDEARRLADDAASRTGPRRPWALNTLGWVALALDDRKRAAEACIAAGEEARARGDQYALAESLELRVFVCDAPEEATSGLEEALAIWRDMGGRVRAAECELALARLSSGARAEAAAERAEQALRTYGVRLGSDRPAGLLRVLSAPVPTPVRVEVLGGFRVVRDGVPVRQSEWSSRKSRELLRLLVCRRGRAAPRALAMEALWPGEDPRKLSNRLSVALSTLRAVLDPEKRFAPDHFVHADSESIALNPATVLVDVEMFLHEAEMGLSRRSADDTGEAAAWLRQAESSYAGDVLEDDPYNDFAVPLREEARARYLAVAHALAADAEETDVDAAVSYFHRILANDPFDERAHLGLTTALERSGRRGESRRAYRLYVARMEELGIAPTAFPETDTTRL